MISKPKFVLDRCLGTKKLFQYLKDRNWDLIPFSAIGKDDTPDCEWLLEAGKRNISVISADEKIVTRPIEKSAIQTGLVKMFVLKTKDQSIDSLRV